MRSVDEDRILIFVLFFNFHFETEWKLTTPMSPTSRHSSTSPYQPAEGKGVDGCELDVIGGVMAAQIKSGCNALQK